MNEAIYPNNVLVGIGHHMPEGRKCFKHSAQGFQVFFYNRRKRFPRLLGGFMFDMNGNYPICRELDSAVSSLTLSGMLVLSSTTPPGYYQFHPAVDLAYQRVAEKISSRQRRNLAKIAQEFSKEFGEANRFVLR